MIEKEADRVISQFERFMQDAAPGSVRCQVCLSPNRKAYNRALLLHTRTDKAISEELGIEHCSVRWHRIGCLVTRGGANVSDVDRSPEKLQKRFPIHASAVTQAKWTLESMMALRQEVLKKSPPDRKELFRLVKEISAAAAEFRKAKAEAKLQKAVTPENAEDDLDLSPDTKQAMAQVNKPQEVNGAGQSPTN